MSKETDPFYYGLKIVDWDIFLTLKFKNHRTSSDIDNNFRRKQFESLMIQLTKAAKRTYPQLHSNDILYFASEEKSREDLYHLHSLIVIKRSCMVEPESIRRELVDLVSNAKDEEGNKIFKVPRRVKGTIRENRVYRHCELVQSSVRVNSYINKVQGSYDAGKRIFFNKMHMGKRSPFFIFYRWTLKQKRLA
jgi:hypothetical protein